MFNWFRKMSKSKEDRQFELLDERLIDVQGKLTNLRNALNAHENGNQDKFKQLEALIKTSTQDILDAIAKITIPAPVPAKPLEVKFMFVVKDDNPAVNFSLVLGDVTDAEGNKIPDAQVDVDVVSSDETVLAVTFDKAAKIGSVSFGNPGVASITASVSSGGKLLGSGAADFTVTVGDPAAISNVALNFEGLTEV